MRRGWERGEKAELRGKGREKLVEKSCGGIEKG